MSDTLQVAYRVYRPNRAAYAAILWTGDNIDGPGSVDGTESVPE